MPGLATKQEANRMNKKCMQSSRETGAVSLFVVIFAALLMSVVTVGFIQLMLKDQQQATANDLSQSAYDSAQAGVEDAKRLLLAAQPCGASPSGNCAKMLSAISSQNCDTLPKSGLVNATGGETLIQQTSGDAALDQAYTCVKIMTQTPDYQGSLAQNESNIVPLKAAGSFDTITINWFSRDDLSAGTTKIDFPSTGGVTLPPVGATWGNTVPPLLRAQLIQTGANFSLSDFDTTTASNKSDNSTLFLYPSKAGASTAVPTDFTFDTRHATSVPMAPQPVKCVANLGVAQLYACSVSVKLQAPVDGNTAQRGAYLRLSSLYNAAHYSVQLANGPTPVLFDGVQPAVDSTGRANSLFRRVSARIELKGVMAYPEAAVDLAGGLCKNFLVTDKAADYQDFATSSCTVAP